MTSFVKGQALQWVWILELSLKKALINDILVSEIGLGFEELGGTPPLRIPSSTLSGM